MRTAKSSAGSSRKIDVQSVAAAPARVVEWNAAKSELEVNLWRWNMACGIFHLLSACLVLGLTFKTDKVRNFKIPLLSTYADWSRAPYPKLILRESGRLPFAATAAGFPMMSAAAHFLAVVFFKTYIKDLEDGINKSRWYEYALSSSLMIALIAQVFGVYHIHSLVLIMGVNASMNLFGYLHEAMNKGRSPAKVEWSAFCFGCIAGAFPWAIIASQISSNANIDKVPWVAWAMLAPTFIFFNAFPINMYCQYMQIGWWSDKYQGWPRGGYYFGERVYQMLSIVAKTILVWCMFVYANSR